MKTGIVVYAQLSNIGRYIKEERKRWKDQLNRPVSKFDEKPLNPTYGKKRKKTERFNKKVSIFMT